MTQLIKTGLVSYGMSGRVFHAPLLSVNPRFSLSHILERSPKGAIGHYPDVHIVKSYDELLAVDEIELIIVNTPDNTHFELASRALEAGKHVVVEKPFVMTVEEGEQLIHLAEQRGLILTTFQNRRWDGDFMTVQKVIEEGMLGRLVSYEAHFDRYRNFIEQNTWKEEGGEQDARILYNLGAHLIDQAYLLFGMPQGVSAKIGKQRTGTHIDDYFDLTLEYPDVHVTLKSSYMVREEGPRYMLHGTEGSFLKWGIDPQEDELKKGIMPDRPAWGVEERKYWGKLNTNLSGMHVIGRVETYPGNYNIFYDHLYESIRAQRPLDVHPKDSLQVIRLIRAAIESNQSKTMIRF